jgi:hypothetical protein
LKRASHSGCRLRNPRRLTWQTTQKVPVKKPATKTAKKVALKSPKQRVTGKSSNLDLQEALKDATSKLMPPRPGSDIVTCEITSLEVTVGGFTNIPELTVTLVSK